MAKYQVIIDDSIVKKVKEIHHLQMSAFGGLIPGFEIKEIFKKDGYTCVKFNNGDWYHYDLTAETWW